MNSCPEARLSKGHTGLRIYTHNILGRRSGWEERRGVLAQGVQLLSPDIVMFQEEIYMSDYDQTRDLLGPDYQIAHSTARSHPEESGISIASRWPISHISEIDLTIGGPSIDEFHWAALLATIDAPSPFGPVMIVNYFPDAAADREFERERQAVVIAKAVEQLIDSPDQLVVLGGDLDADPDAASLRFLTGKQSLEGMSVCYRNAWDVVHPGERGWTLDPINDLFRDTMNNWPYRRVDHLLVRCGSTGMPPVNICACELIGDEPMNGVWASDHFGLMVDLNWNSHSAPGT